MTKHRRMKIIKCMYKKEDSDGGFGVAVGGVGGELNVDDGEGCIARSAEGGRRTETETEMGVP